MAKPWLAVVIFVCALGASHRAEAAIVAMPNTPSIADDVDGDPVFMAKNEFYLGYTRERAEGINFSNVKDVKKKA